MFSPNGHASCGGDIHRRRAPKSTRGHEQLGAPNAVVSHPTRYCPPCSSRPPHVSVSVERLGCDLARVLVAGTPARAGSGVPRCVCKVLVEADIGLRGCTVCWRWSRWTNRQVRHALEGQVDQYVNSTQATRINAANRALVPTVSTSRRWPSPKVRRVIKAEPEAAADDNGPSVRSVLNPERRRDFGCRPRLCTKESCDHRVAQGDLGDQLLEQRHVIRGGLLCIGEQLLTPRRIQLGGPGRRLCGPAVAGHSKQDEKDSHSDDPNGASPRCRTGSHRIILTPLLAGLCQPDQTLAANRSKVRFPRRSEHVGDRTFWNSFTRIRG